MPKMHFANTFDVFLISYMFALYNFILNFYLRYVPHIYASIMFSPEVNHPLAFDTASNKLEAWSD